MTPIFSTFTFCYGLVWGSFLNVCIHRIPNGESILRPRSRCPHCGHNIRAYDNIPLLSYLILRAHCRYCQGRISPRYPFVELLTGLLFLGLFFHFGVGLAFFYYLIFGSVLLVLLFIDFDHQILPDRLTLPAIPLGLLGSWWIPGVGWIRSLFGVILGASLLLGIIGLYYLLRGTQGMGFGDVKMLAMMGAFLGWEGVLVTVVTASFLGSLCGLAAMLLYGKNLQTALPFGSFLAVAGLGAIFYGPMSVAWYTQLF